MRGPLLRPPNALLNFLLFRRLENAENRSNGIDHAERVCFRPTSHRRILEREARFRCLNEHGMATPASKPLLHRLDAAHSHSPIVRAWFAWRSSLHIKRALQPPVRRIHGEE